MADIYPTFQYADAAAAIDWLERAFGLTRDKVYTAEDGTVAHAQLAYGTGMVMVGTATPPVHRPESAGFAVYVAVDDIDAHHARARAAGAPVVQPLRDTDYGSREYAVRDVGGYVWSFGTYRP
ncbi:VOC family protein [Plantactinospora siamensis]|uniref:VOC family protein n=1 Tax=Plantactinospora siamensis TaxID=555372 RepID=A0ABV6P1C7_9ACTN